MEELKKLVSEQAGITGEQAGKSIEVVSAYIKARIPGALHSSLDNVLKGEDIEDSIKSKAESFAQEIRERAGGLSNDLKQAFDKAFKSKP